MAAEGSKPRWEEAVLICVVVAILICVVVAECWIVRHRRGAQLAYLRGRGSNNTERGAEIR